MLQAGLRALAGGTGRLMYSAILLVDAGGQCLVGREGSRYTAAEPMLEPPSRHLQCSAWSIY